MKKIVNRLDIKVENIRIVSFFVLVAFFSVVMFGTSAFCGWRDEIGLQKYQSDLIGEDANATSKVIYDDFGQIITEDEIQQYTQSDKFWPSLYAGFGGMMIGAGLGMLYGYSTYDRNDPVGGMALFVDAAGAGMLGFFMGVIWSYFGSPDRMMRSDAISLIRKKRVADDKAGNI